MDRIVFVQRTIRTLLFSFVRFVLERESTVRSQAREIILEIFHTFPNDKEESGYSLADVWHKTPTFEQFVRYIVDPAVSGPDYGTSVCRMGAHWLPYYMQCNPCAGGSEGRAVPDSVLLLEDLAEDATCYLNNVPDPGIQEEDWRHLHHVNAASEGSSSINRIRKRYFHQLTKELMTKVYQRYKPDYLLYGYQHDTFFKDAKDA